MDKGRTQLGSMYRQQRKRLMKSVRQYYRVDRRRISLIKFIFEAYEGVAVVTTMDAKAGVIFLTVAPGCETVARDVMADLSRNVMIESCNPPQTNALQDCQ